MSTREDFWTGYRRSHAMTEALSAVLVASLREHPTERLGQLICNVTAIDTTGLFALRDEVILDCLGARLSAEPDVWGCEYANVGHGGCALAATADSPPPTIVQMKDLLGELADRRQELSIAHARLRRADSLIQALQHHGTEAARLAAVSEAQREYDAVR